MTFEQERQRMGELMLQMFPAIFDFLKKKGLTQLHEDFLQRFAMLHRSFYPAGGSTESLITVNVFFGVDSLHPALSLKVYTKNEIMTPVSGQIVLNDEKELLEFRVVKGVANEYVVY